MTRYFALILPALIALSAIGESSENWPQYRGPQASGVNSNTELPTKWSIEKKENVAWRTPIAGLAHSSPIIWGDRVYVTTAVRPGKADLKVGLYGDISSANDQESHTWRLMALDKKNGAVMWDRAALEKVPRVKRHTKSTHCNSTPATDGEHIVAIFGSEGLFCFDMNGELVWKKDLGPMDAGFFMVPSAQWGFASSPVIYDGKAVVQCDVQTNSFLAVFDLKDGRELWRTERKDVPTWSTPAVVKAGDGTQVLVNGWHHSGGYDFATGKEIWRLDGGGDIPVPTPIIGDGVAYFTSAHGRLRPMSAIRLTAEGNITPREIGQTNAAIAWSHAREGNYMQTPILVRKYLYGCADYGGLTCFDARSGEIQYSERLSSTGQGFTASPVSDGRNLYFASETGNVFVVPVGPKFSIAATNPMEETCMATPAISEGSLFIRTRENLVCLRKL